MVTLKIEHMKVCSKEAGKEADRSTGAKLYINFVIIGYCCLAIIRMFTWLAMLTCYLELAKVR